MEGMKQLKFEDLTFLGKKRNNPSKSNNLVHQVLFRKNNTKGKYYQTLNNYMNMFSFDWEDGLKSAKTTATVITDKNGDKTEKVEKTKLSKLL